MSPFAYAWPDDRLAQGLVAVLALAFLIWSAFLAYLWLRLLRTRSELSRAADVGILIKHRLNGQAAPDDPDNIARNRAADHSSAHADLAFDEYCSAADVAPARSVGRHVFTIFHAGWFESRIDISDLLAHTTSRLFAANAVLQGVLSLFIVFGLLGTLFGLSDSLAQLAPSQIQSSAAVSPAVLSRGLEGLLSHLKGAFAPSIWGVSLTVLGVLMFTAYVRLACTPVREMLADLTLTVWVPRLLPTAPQRLLETLRRSEEQMRQNFAAAREVAQLAETLRSDLDVFGPNIRHANETVRGLSATVESAAAFARSFGEGVSRLQEFHKPLEALYGQFVDERRQTHEAMRAAVAALDERHNRIEGLITSHQRTLTEAFGALRTYEAAYVEQRKGIDSGIQATLASAKHLMDLTEQRNAELVGQIGKPLTEIFTHQMQSIEQTLSGRLATLVQQIQQFDVPMKQSAALISTAFDNIMRRIEQVVRDLQTEFQRQNTVGHEQVSRVGEVREQLVVLNQLLKAIGAGQGAQNDQLSSLRRSVDALAVELSKPRSRPAEPAMTGWPQPPRPRPPRWWERWLYWR
jgi:predicted  nucleic acid-binding Zn-ribbon protein